MNRTPPTVPGSWPLGNLAEMRQDVLGLLLRGSQMDAGVVRYKIGPMQTFLVNDSELVSEVLTKKKNNYDKNSRSTKLLKLICGNSILTSNSDEWRVRRNSWNPQFHKESTEKFLTDIKEQALSSFYEWEKLCKKNSSIDITSHISILTYSIIGKYLFGDAFIEKKHLITKAVHELVSFAYQRWGNLINLPLSFPTKAHRQFQSALKVFDEIIEKLMLKSNPDHQETLFDLFVHQMESETGRPLTPVELRNEVITMLIAGHETVANTICWSIYYGTQSNCDLQQIADEGNTLINRDHVTLNDLSKCIVTDALLKESLRLSPPIWVIERHAIEEDILGGYMIPKNASLLISPYTLHRDSRYWTQPGQFVSNRFNDKTPSAYIPFGMGQRFCIGRELAKAEAIIILSLLFNRFDIQLLDKKVIAEPAITLRIKGEVKIHLKKRSIIS